GGEPGARACRGEERDIGKARAAAAGPLPAEIVPEEREAHEKLVSCAAFASRRVDASCPRAISGPVKDRSKSILSAWRHPARRLPARSIRSVSAVRAPASACSPP